MNRTVLMLGFIVQPPWTFECAFQTDLKLQPNICLYPGIISEFLAAIYPLIHIDYRLIPINNQSNPWKKALEMLENGQIDSLAHVQSISFDKSMENYRFTQPIVLEANNVAVLVKTHADHRSWHIALDTLFRPFSWEIWLGIFTVFLADRYFGKAVFGRKHTIGRNVRRQFGHAWSLIIAFCAIGFVGVYRGTLLAKILLDHKVPLFTSIDELIELIDHQHITVYSVEMEHWFAQIASSDLELNQRFTSALANNPPIIVPSVGFSNYSQIVSRIAAGERAILLGSKFTMLYECQRDCDVIVVPLELPIPNRLGALLFYNHPDQSAINLQKSKIINKLDNAIQSNRHLIHGIMKHYDKLLASTQCDLATSIKPMSFQKVLACFFMLLVGLSISIVIFFVECFWRYRNSGSREENFPGNYIQKSDFLSDDDTIIVRF